MNIGIIETDKAEENLKCWWWTQYGYSFYEAASTHSANGMKQYGQYWKSGDVIDMVLDLKENKALSYAVNDKYHEKAWDIVGDKVDMKN